MDQATEEEFGAEPTNEIVFPSHIDEGAVKLTVWAGVKCNVIVSHTSNIVPHGDFAFAIIFNTTEPASICPGVGVKVGFKAFLSLKPKLLFVPSIVHRTLSYSVPVTPEITKGCELQLSWSGSPTSIVGFGCTVIIWVTTFAAQIAVVFDVNWISKSELLFGVWLKVTVSELPFSNAPWFPLISVHARVLPSGFNAVAV